MKLLLVAATPTEIAPTVAAFPQTEVLYTGLGSMLTAYHLGKRLASSTPDLLIQAGVGGAVDLHLPLGGIYRIVSDRQVDLGAEDRDENTLGPSDIGFPLPPPFDRYGALPAPSLTGDWVDHLPKAHGGTVNRAHGSRRNIQRLRRRFPTVQVESMEGAAFFYACADAGAMGIQLRAISNYVTERDRAAWRLDKAITSLNDELIALLGRLTDRR